MPFFKNDLLTSFDPKTEAMEVRHESDYELNTTSDFGFTHKI